MSEVASIAVIIPARNAARDLVTALESARNQTLPAAEIIVVDDGSTDDTAAVAEQQGATVLRQEHAGPGAARNRGIAATSADFVAFLDADDWYAPYKLERSIALLAQLGAQAMATDSWLVTGDRIDRRKNESQQVPSALTKELLIRGNPIACSTVVCRRRAVIDAGSFSEDEELVACEDYDLWLRMTHREPIAYLPEPLTFFRVYAEDRSTTSRYLNGVDKVLARVASEHIGEAHFQQLLARRRASARLEVARELLRHGRRREALDLVRAAAKISPSWAGCKLWVRARLSSERSAS